MRCWFGPRQYIVMWIRSQRVQSLQIVILWYFFHFQTKQLSRRIQQKSSLTKDQFRHILSKHVVYVCSLRCSIRLISLKKLTVSLRNIKAGVSKFELIEAQELTQEWLLKQHLVSDLFLQYKRSPAYTVFTMFNLFCILFIIYLLLNQF